MVPQRDRVVNVTGPMRNRKGSSNEPQRRELKERPTPSLLLLTLIVPVGKHLLQSCVLDLKCTNVGVIVYVLILNNGISR